MIVKIKTLNFILKDKKLFLLFIIDFIFYTYLILGFVLAAYISKTYLISLEEISAYWIALFIPILILKFIKELKKDNINRKYLYKKNDDDN